MEIPAGVGTVTSQLIDIEPPGNLMRVDLRQYHQFCKAIFPSGTGRNWSPSVRTR
jgi:hypothetical protein